MQRKRPGQHMRGAELRDIRVRLGLTQPAMARALGIGHFITVSNYEREIWPIPLKVAMLARTLR